MRKDHALTPAQKMDVRAALAKLAAAKSTLSLSAMADLVIDLHGRNARAEPTPASVAVDRYLHGVLAGGKRAGTFRFYDQKLGAFAAWADALNLDQITQKALKAWLLGLPGGATTKSMQFRAVRALYRWAIKQDPPMTALDPTAGLTLDLPAAQHEVKFLSVAQAEAILRGVSASFLPAVALHLFAGLRPEEMTPVDVSKPRLQWEHVRFDEQFVRVPAEVSKTGKARLIEGLPPALWAWVKLPAEGATGPICTRGLRWTLQNVKTAGGFGPKNPWPFDGLRHTFATYAVALTSDPGKVALWLGHEGNPTMLHKHYRGLATKAQAEKFFALRP